MKGIELSLFEMEKISGGNQSDIRTVPPELRREIEVKARACKAKGTDKDSAIVLLCAQYPACPPSVVVVIVSKVYNA